MKKSIEWVKRMEIKIEETEHTLKIIKSCRQELKWAFIIGIICNICLIYPLLKETPGELYFGFALFYTPIFLLIQCLFCYRFSYEVIFIKEDYVCLLSSFRKPNIYNAKKFSTKNIIKISAKKFNGSILLRSHNIFKKAKPIKDHPNYKIHFYFKEETEEYYAWGYEIPIEKALQIVDKIKIFLKDSKNIQFEKSEKQEV